MNRLRALHARLHTEPADRGFSLIEIIIAMTIFAGVTAAIAMSLMTSLRVADNASQRTKESADAQLISAFLVKDAQAAGGSNPFSASVDITLGVSTSDAAGCVGTGTLLVRLRWVDHSSTTARVDHLATYWLDAANQQLTRRTCSTPAQSSDTTIVLGRHMANASAATGCTPVGSCLANMPDTVSMALTETNSQTAPTAYTYTLTASLRPQAQTPPVVAAATRLTTIIALGDNCPSPALSQSGSGSATIYGDTIANHGATCTQAQTVTSAYFRPTVGDVNYVYGTCSGCVPANTTTLANPVDDPLTILPLPANAPTPNPATDTTRSSTGTCAGTGNPSPAAGHYTGNANGLVFRDPVSITSNVTFDPGVYIFCAGFSVSSHPTVVSDHALLYVAGGGFSVSGQVNMGMTAYAQAPYVNMVIWQSSSSSAPMTFNGGSTVNNFSGIVYAQQAVVTLSGGAGAMAGAIVAKAVVFAGNGNFTVGTPPLVITAPATLAAGTVNVAYPNTQVTVTGGGPPYAYTATGFPAGMGIDAVTGIISGTPAQTGTFPVNVTVTDSVFPVAGSVTRSYSLAVGGPPLQITTPVSSTLTPWTINRSYPAGSTFGATGGVPGYTWSASGLPNGMTVNAATGALSGTPTAGGSFTAAVTVRDTVATQTPRNFTLVINPAPTVSTASVPNAGLSQPYSGATLAAAGGTAPLGNWAVSSGTLPPGITLSAAGVLAGTATTASTYNFSVTVTDAAGAVSAARALTIVVGAAPVPSALSLANGGTAGRADAGDSVSITFSQALNANSFCSAWGVGSVNGSLSANGDVVVTITDAGANDVLTVTSGSCTFNLGSVALGGNYVATNQTLTFSGNGANKSSISWNATTRVLQIILGAITGTSSTGVAAAAPVYTPSTAIVSTPNGIPLAAASFTGASSRF